MKLADISPLRTTESLSFQYIGLDSKCAGHMVRMRDWRLPKRSETKKHGHCRKRGRRQLRCDDCLKRDPRKTEEGEK